MQVDARTRMLGIAGMLVGLFGVVASLGCGPIWSTSRIGKADVALERARVAEAYRKAPYEFFSARYYLHKAKEEWGYSEFEASYDFAEQAQEAAESARRKTKENPWSDPVKGRKKSYRLRPQDTITVDAEQVQETEEADQESKDSPTSSEPAEPTGDDGGGSKSSPPPE